MNNVVQNIPELVNILFTLSLDATINSRLVSLSLVGMQRETRVWITCLY